MLLNKKKKEKKLILLAYLCFKYYDYDNAKSKAINYCNKVLRYNSNNIDALLYKGFILYDDVLNLSLKILNTEEHKIVDECIYCYDNIINQNDVNDNPYLLFKRHKEYAWLLKAGLLINIRHYNEGMKCFQNAKRINPDNHKINEVIDSINKILEENINTQIKLQTIAFIDEDNSSNFLI